MNQTKKGSLLDQALALHEKPKTGDLPTGTESEALAVAWLTGGVTVAAVGKVLGIHHGPAVYAWMALRLRDALESGLLKVK